MYGKDIQFNIKEIKFFTIFFFFESVWLFTQKISFSSENTFENALVFHKIIFLILSWSKINKFKDILK